jgi:ribosome-associated protein
MSKRKTINNTRELLCSVIEGIRKKKGIDIVSIDFSGLKDTVCDYFVICHGESNTHVNAIAESVEDTVKSEINEKVWSKEGFENSQWILLDYASVVVHIFQKTCRTFYNLESLWADGKLTIVT